MAKAMTTKEKIVSFCLNMFAKRGFDGVSMRDIAAGVGIKESSVYNHFQGKQDILEHIVKEQGEFCDVTLKNVFLSIQERQNVPQAYVQEDFLQMAHGLFRGFLCNKNVIKLWSILSIEQYKFKKYAEIQNRLFYDDVLEGLMTVFYQMSKQGILKNQHPALLALEFYSPIFLIFNRYFVSGHENMAEIEPLAQGMLTRHVEQFYQNNKQ